MVVIYESDTEEVRRDKRETNLIEMAEDYQCGSEKRPYCISEDCKVDQPEDIERQKRLWDYRIGDTQFTNGLLRIQYINGKNRKEYHMGFAGRARSESEMNMGQGRKMK